MVLLRLNALSTGVLAWFSCRLWQFGTQKRHERFLVHTLRSWENPCIQTTNRPRLHVGIRTFIRNTHTNIPPIGNDNSTHSCPNWRYTNWNFSGFKVCQQTNSKCYNSICHLQLIFIINCLRCKVNTFLGIMQIYLNFELRILNYEKMTCSKCS